MGCNLINKGKGASGNDFIFHNICKLSHEFKKDDIVIVEWSYMERFRWVDVSGGLWEHSSANTTAPNLSNSTALEIVMNRTHRLYMDDIDDYDNILNTLSISVGFKIYYWTPDAKLLRFKNQNKLNKQRYLDLDYIRDYDPDSTIFREVKERGGEEIVHETNGEVKDYHFGERGHQILSDMFYEEISKRQ